MAKLTKGQHEAWGICCRQLINRETGITITAVPRMLCASFKFSYDKVRVGTRLI